MLLLCLLAYWKGWTTTNMRLNINTFLFISDTCIYRHLHLYAIKVLYLYFFCLFVRIYVFCHNPLLLICVFGSLLCPPQRPLKFGQKYYISPAVLSAFDFVYSKWLCHRVIFPIYIPEAGKNRSIHLRSIAHASIEQVCTFFIRTFFYYGSCGSTCPWHEYQISVKGWGNWP